MCLQSCTVPFDEELIYNLRYREAEGGSVL